MRQPWRRGDSLTSANYKLAKELLKDRYGKEQRLKAAHINNLLNLKVCSNSYVELWRFYNQVTCDVRQLEALEVTTDKYGVCLAPIVLSRLPEDLRMEWAREGDGHEDDSEHLLTFLKSEIARKERAGHW